MTVFEEPMDIEIEVEEIDNREAPEPEMGPFESIMAQLSTIQKEHEEKISTMYHSQNSLVEAIRAEHAASIRLLVLQSEADKAAFEAEKNNLIELHEFEVNRLKEKSKKLKENLLDTEFQLSQSLEETKEVRKEFQKMCSKYTAFHTAISETVNMNL